MFFFHTALCIIATNTNAKFQGNQTGDDKVMLRTKNYCNELSNSRANNSTCSGPITPLKVALQILGQKFYKNTKQIILILPKPFNFHS